MRQTGRTGDGLDPKPEEVDRICDRFEAAWKAGERPAIEERLRDLPGGSRGVLLRELLFLELEYRRRFGEVPSPDEYLPRFPDQGDLIGEVFRESRMITVLVAPGSGSSAAPAPVQDPSGGSARKEIGATPVLTPDTRLGHYQIVSLLGKGGMGQVYRATDLRLQREVAVKVLPEGLAGESDALGRFEREARALAALHHRSLLTIHDFGSERGISYIVMELLEGETLRARLNRSIPSWQEAVRLSFAIAEGLAAAHSKGVVHRDLKPENVFLTTDGEVKILDFGLARLKEASSAHDAVSTTKTHPGIILGTFPYMSPEHVRGCLIDERSDLFSFGTMFYEVLLGNCPFLRETPAEIMAAILKEEVPPMARSGKAVPPELERIVSKCLKKKPEERFQSAGEIAGLLKSILLECEARPRRRFFLTISSALSVPLFLTATALILLRTCTPPIHELVDEAGTVNSMAKGILDTEEQEKIEKAKELLSALIREPGDPAARTIHAEAQALLGRAYWQLSNVSRSPSFAMPKAKAHALHALELDPSCLEAKVVLAVVTHRFDWNWKEAEKEFQEAIQLGGQAPEPHQEYGRYLMLKGDQVKAREEFDEARRRRPEGKLIETDTAESYYYEGKTETAINLLQDILASTRERPFEVLWRLGEAYCAKEKYPESVAYFEEAIKALKRPNPEAIGELGHAYARWGKPEKAREVLRQLDEMEKKERYVSAVARAVVFIGLGEKKEAYEGLRKGVEQRDEWLVYLKVDPVFDALRKDQEFMDLMQLAHIPP